jgi:hypothetical protein
MKLDDALAHEMSSMIQRFADGAPWTGVGFDLVRSNEMSMENVFCILMSAEDFKTISFMMQVIQDKCARERVFEVITKELDIIRKERESLPDDM